MKERVLVACAIFAGFCCSAAPNLDNFDIWNDTEAVNETRDGRVLNFFPIPVEEECKANDGRRKGICMNTYECRMQGGKSFGQCALGFGVCCVFTATCGQDAYNNITYFVSPDFPDLSQGVSTCSLKVKKIDPEIAQLRLDFVHFNLGQPNRRTGVCEEDSFLMTAGPGTKEFTLCGFNSGQHAFFDVENVNEAITISMNLSKKATPRLWEVRIEQIPFSQRAPVGCLQYHTGARGFIQTMNFADNGRHLANQDYSICMRQESGMCSIAYEPCDQNSFRIGSRPQADPNSAMGLQVSNDEGSGAGLDETPVARQLDSCSDRIVFPCDSEDFLIMGDSGPGVCNLAHCGSSLCPNGESPCRVESNTTPFTVGVHFEEVAREESPEDNIGMCLSYEQLPCMV